MKMMGADFKMIAYVDDVVILSIGKHLPTISDLMESLGGEERLQLL